MSEYIEAISPALFIVVIFLSALIQRVSFQLFQLRTTPYTGADTHFHLYFIDSIRRHGFRVPKYYERFLGNFIISYPYSIHQAFALTCIPTRWLEHWGNPFLDTAYVTIGSYLLLQLGSSQTDVAHFCIIYVFTPLLFSPQSIGPRVQCFTPRLAAEISIGIFFISWCYWDVHPSLWLGTVIALTGAFTLLGSSFGLQCLILGACGLSLAAANWSPFVFLTGSFLIALISQPQLSRKVFKAKWSHWQNYLRLMREGSIGTARRNIGASWLRHMYRHRWQQLYREVNHFNPLLIVATKAPAALAIALSVVHTKSLPPFEINLLTFASVFVILFVATSLRPFLFLGEAERYISNAYVAIAILGASTLPHYSYPIIFCFGVVFQLLDFITHKTLVKNLRSDEDLKLIEALNSLPPSRVAFVPGGLGGWRALRLTHHSCITPFHSILGGNQEQDNQHLYLSYEQLDLRRFNKLVQFYDINVLALRESAIQEQALPSDWWQAYGLTRTKVSDDVSIYTRTSISNSQPDSRTS